MRIPRPIGGCLAMEKKNTGRIKSEVQTNLLKILTNLALCCYSAITVNYLLSTHGGWRSSVTCTTTLPSQLEFNSNFTLSLSNSIMKLSICMLRTIVMANSINSLVFVMYTVLVLCEVRAVTSSAIIRRLLILRARVFYQIIPCDIMWT